MKNWKYILIVITQFLIVSSSLANDFDRGLTQASKKEYASAIKDFKKVIEKDQYNASAYYNIGFCQFNLNQFGEAIWSFEKALQYDPKNSNALKNIEICHSKLNLPEYEPIHSGTVRSLFAFGSLNWSIIAIVISCIIAVLCVLFKLKKSNTTKRIIFLFIITAILFEICSIFLAFESHKAFHQPTSAIVLDPTIPTYLTEEGEKSVIAIPEGTRLDNISPVSNGKFSVTLVNGQEVIIDGKGWKKL